MRSEPPSPPAASEPWQKPQCAMKVFLPASALAASTTGLSAAPAVRPPPAGRGGCWGRAAGGAWAPSSKAIPPTTRARTRAGMSVFRTSKLSLKKEAGEPNPRSPAGVRSERPFGPRINLPLEAHLHERLPEALLLRVVVGDHAGELPRIRRADVAVRRAGEVGVVEDVRDRAGQGELQPLGQREGLRDAQVVGVEALPHQDASTRVAEVAGRRPHERRRVEPLVHRASARILVAVGEPVGQAARRVRIRGVEARVLRIEVLSRPEVADGLEVPAPQDV